MSSKCKEVLSSTYIKGIVEQATQTLEAGLSESTGLKIQQIFQETAKECLRKSNSTHTKQKNNKSKPRKKWFDSDCVRLKNQVKMSSKKKHKSPSLDNRNQHRDLLKNYKRQCGHKQVEFWKKEKTKIDDAEEGFWETWRTLGENITGQQHIKAGGEEWEKYFTQLYNNHLCHKETPPPRVESTNQALNKPFTNKELRNTLKNLKTKKAAGHDGICNELLKLATEEILEFLESLLN